MVSRALHPLAKPLAGRCHCQLALRGREFGLPGPRRAAHAPPSLPRPRQAASAPRMGQNVAIRVLINGGNTAVNAACSSAETKTLQTAFINAVAKTPTRRALSTSRQLAPDWCYWYCQGFWPGYCYLVYPACWGVRMLQEDAEVPVVEGVEDEVRALVTATATNSTLLQQCQTAQGAVIQSVKLAVNWGSVSQSCIQLLTTQVTMDCFVPPTR